MNAASDSSNNNGKSKRGLIAILAFLTLWGFGTTFYFWSENHGMISAVNEGKLDSERLLAEKLQLEKQVMELNTRYTQQEAARADAEGEVDQLRKRVQEAIARSKGLEGAARKSRDLGKEVAALRDLKQQLQDRLNAAASGEQDLLAKLEKMTSERDALATQLEERANGAEMVNNAEVDAVRGKKGKLTVVARRAKEIRMAFDLPQNLASDASFKIITPSGRNYTAQDPSISMTIDQPEAEPMATLDLMPGLVTGERAARVHLKFMPTEKLQPGTYRIDVMTGGAYLNTVLLNLR